MVYFFDTSALQFRYIDGPKAHGIRRIISSQKNECFIADLSILEIASAFGRHCRTNNLSLGVYSNLDRLFWRDVSEQRLKVWETGKRELVKARALLRYAGVKRKRKLTSSDALIAVTCLEVALSRHERVTFCLHDWPLFDILRDISAYSRTLRFHFIGTDKAAAQEKVSPAK